jgi:hypothetical protein
MAGAEVCQDHVMDPSPGREGFRPARYQRGSET